MLNKAMIIGNLGQEPEVRFTSSGQAVCTLRVATNEKWNDKEGKLQERTEWHSVVVWGKQGESCGKYLNKGSKVYVEGRIQTREWEDKDGNKRYSTEIVALTVRFLDSKGEQGGGGGGQQQSDSRGGSSRFQGGVSEPSRKGKQAARGGYDPTANPVDDDIPF